jgi:ATP-dependent Clp protease, protease subunit
MKKISKPLPRLVNSTPRISSEEDKNKNLASLDDLGIFLLIEGVDHDTYKKFVEKVVLWNQSWQAFSQISLIINCYGGDAAATFGVVDFVDWSTIPVHTFANGMCASGAFIIMMAGEKGHRVCTPRTQFLSHNFHGGGFGNYPQLVASRKSEDMLFQSIVRHYSEHTKLKTEKDIRKYLLQDTDIWLTPEECLEYGVIDRITTDKKEIPKVIYPGFGDKKGKK